MILWKKYDPDNPPPFEIDFLVCTKDGFYKVAELQRWSDDLEWVENQECLCVQGVTHYAEINPPTTD